MNKEVFEECEYIELHSPLFHTGKNHGLKLKPTADLKLHYGYDGNRERVRITYKGKSTFQPMGAVQNYTPITVIESSEDVIDRTLPINLSHPKDVRKIKSAQVSGPHDHVFQGEGAGRKRDK